MTAINPEAILKEHRTELRKRSRSAWADFVGRSAIREYAAYGIAVFCVIIALLNSDTAHKFLSAIPVVHDTREVDGYGQAVAHDTAVKRVPPDKAAGHVIDTFIPDVFNVFKSPAAMQRDYLQAQSLTDESGNALGTIRDLWSRSSPLQQLQDGTYGFVRPVPQEMTTQVVSTLDRGPAPVVGGGRMLRGNIEEYEVNFVVTGENDRAQTLYKGDIWLSSGGAATDDTVLGQYVYHFDFSIVKPVTQQ